jgi:DNA recombination protein Rad52
MDWEKITLELSKKLDPSHVMPAKPFGPKGDYIEGWHAMAEANRIFGFDGWDYDISDCKCVSERPKKIGKDGKDGWAVSYTATVLVVVGQVRRKDVGAGHGYDLDCGLAHESAIKEAVTDALKRALRSFGNPFGLALYDKSRENVGINADANELAAAKSAIASTPDLPALGAWWKGLVSNARHIAEHPEIIAAKDKRKAELAKEQAA